ncbi:MAG: exodeoxyribonuclease VII small subunit [Candidatus Saccharibacteria bacterium]
MKSAKPIDYRKLSAELEELTNSMQSSDIDIDSAAEAYERGLQIIDLLETHLKTTQNKVNRLKASFDKQ